MNKLLKRIPFEFAILGLTIMFSGCAGEMGGDPFAVTNGSLPFTHTVGTTPCPQVVGSTVVSNVSEDTLTFDFSVVQSPPFTITCTGDTDTDASTCSVPLEPTFDTTVEVIFDCSSQPTSGSVAFTAGMMGNGSVSIVPTFN